MLAKMQGLKVLLRQAQLWHRATVRLSWLGWMLRAQWALERQGRVRVILEAPPLVPRQLAAHRKAQVPVAMEQLKAVQQIFLQPAPPLKRQGHHQEQSALATYAMIERGVNVASLVTWLSYPLTNI
jgi:hypothetical protein